jgi:hypothetical protein
MLSASNARLPPQADRISIKFMATDSDPQTTSNQPLDPPERRWPVVIAIMAVAGLYVALPESLVVGPRWLFVLVVASLLVLSIVANARGNYQLNSVSGHLLAAILTLFMVWSLVLLVRALPAHTESPIILLRSAAALWVTNVLVFALWYWRLDAGGPHQRDLRAGHPSGSFLFAQMTFREDDVPPEWKGWSPDFIDYLFLAFNTSTAFSPTDVPVLSRWAKLLTMAQASISLTVVVILAARAVNIL